VPAAAVIPAPIAYIKVVAVKKLVVGFLTVCACPGSYESRGGACRSSFWEAFLGRKALGSCLRSFTLRKLECLRQAYAVNTLAWNNKIGLRSYFVGFRD